MSVTTTTAAAAIGANDQAVVVTSATGFAVGNVICVDNEFMVQTGAAVGTSIPVQRGGKNGSVQSAHPILSTVTTGLSTDFPAPQPGSANNPGLFRPVTVSYGASGAITPPTVPTTIFLNKASAAAMTLTNPSASTPDGTEVTVYSNTAAAHTVTYTEGFHQNTTSSDVITFAATSGVSFTMIASRGVWGLKCLGDGATLA